MVLVLCFNFNIKTMLNRYKIMVCGHILDKKLEKPCNSIRLDLKRHSSFYTRAKFSHVFLSMLALIGRISKAICFSSKFVGIINEWMYEFT